MYLWSDAQHLEGWRDVEVVRNADVTEVDGKGPAPDTEPVDVEDGQLTGQRQDQRLGVVASKWFGFAVLVGHFGAFEAVFSRVRTGAHPEEGVFDAFQQRY